MGEKIKIFTGGDKPEGFLHVEEEISSWLSENSNIEITNRLISTVTGRSEIRGHQRGDDGTFVNLTIVLFYRSK